VTILQRGDRILKEFDPDLVGWLMESFAAIGVDVRLRTKVQAVEKTDGGYRVSASADGHPLSLEADLVVHAAGRRPALDTLDLHAAGVAAEDGRLRLNEYLQSVSNAAAYAAGDAAGVGPPLTPVSSYDAKVVTANMLNGNHVKPNYQGVPSVAFTIPPIASVGWSETQLRDQAIEFRMKSEKTSNWFTARQAAEAVYGFKVLVDRKSDLILGAHLVGPHVDEVINVFGLAIRHGLTAEALKTTMFRQARPMWDIWSDGRGEDCRPSTNGVQPYFDRC
jgi:glutathione reductase (NADPH)